MNHETDLSRTGVSIPSHLLANFDEVISQRGYSSRSEGIRDAIRTYITTYTWMAEIEGERQGVITMVYIHHQPGLLPVLADVTHEYKEIIRASLHSHVTHERCVEVILVRGNAATIRNFTERLMAQKGVESVKLTTVSLGDEKQ